MPRGLYFHLLLPRRFPSTTASRRRSLRLIWSCKLHSQTPSRRRTLPGLCRPGARARSRDGQSSSSDKGPAARAAIEVAGAHLLYLPPYSPDFNPIETGFAKLRPSAQTLSVASLISSSERNAQTTSPPLDTIRMDQIRFSSSSDWKRSDCRLRKLHHRTPAASTLGARRHLKRIEAHLAQIEARFQFSSVSSTLNSKSIGLSDVGSKMRCAQPDLLRRLSQVQAAIAVLSRFTLASTPTDTGMEASAITGRPVVQAYHRSMSTKFSSAVTKRFPSCAGIDWDAGWPACLRPIRASATALAGCSNRLPKQ